MPIRNRREENSRRGIKPFMSEETAAVIKAVEESTKDALLASSIEISPTALTLVKTVLFKNGTVITDTEVTAEAVKKLNAGGSFEVRCFIDNDDVIKLAEAHRATRAEIALDMGLALPGPKLVLIGSAPAALNRLLGHRRHEPLSEVCVLATVAGYAAANQLKEKLRESDTAYIITRGKSGGPAAAVNIVAAVMTSKHN